MEHQWTVMQCLENMAQDALFIIIPCLLGGPAGIDHGMFRSPTRWRPSVHSWRRGSGDGTGQCKHMPNCQQQQPASARYSLKLSVLSINDLGRVLLSHGSLDGTGLHWVTEYTEWLHWGCTIDQRLSAPHLGDHPGVQFILLRGSLHGCILRVHAQSAVGLSNI